MENKYVGKTCPFCKTVFKEDDAIVVCSVCDMPHHLACWQENNGCTTFGCTGVIKDFIGSPEKTPDIDPITRHSDTIQPNNDEEIKGLAPSVEPVKKQDRFETLFKSDKRSIQKDSPVIVENITLLIDHSTEKLMARCSFKCLTDKPVIAMMLDVLCTDIWGNVLKSVEGVQLLDLKTKKDASFGQNTPIEIPEKATRSIDVRIKKVLFDDRTSIECGDFICVLDEPQTLLDYFGNPNVAEQYSRETTKKAKYVVRDYSEYWQCTCGAINRQAESSCSACKSEKSKLISILSDPAIAERAATYTQLMQQKAEQEKKETEERIRLAEEQVKREQEAKEVEIKKAEKKAKNKKKRKKAFIVITIILIVLLGLGSVGYFYGIPLYKYNKALDMLDSGRYDAAYDEFKALRGFKDSNDMLNECQYQKGLKQLQNGNYKDAYSLLLELGSYKLSQNKLDSCILEWTDAILNANSESDSISFKNTVSLSSSQATAVYNKIISYIEDHNEFDFWDDYWHFTSNSARILNLLESIPSTYGDSNKLIKFFKDAKTGDIHPVQDWIISNKSLMESLWNYGFMKDFAQDDSMIAATLTGYWETLDGNYNISFTVKEDGVINCSYNLPRPTQPSNTAYYSIKSMIWVWTDKDDNVLTNVYRISFDSFNIIKVYCYSNSKTYTLYR